MSTFEEKVNDGKQVDFLISNYAENIATMYKYFCSVICTVMIRIVLIKLVLGGIKKIVATIIVLNSRRLSLHCIDTLL